MNDGGPAFPRPRGEGGFKYNKGHEGMTLRDYFAGQALIGMLSVCGSEHGAQSLARGLEEHGEIHSGLAYGAYCWADALLKEREKPVDSAEETK